MSDQVARLKDQFNQALMRLEEVLRRSPEQDSIVVDASIQRFEFTIELVWKALKSRLLFEGIAATTPRSVMQEAYAAGWIDDEQLWLNMLRDRNLTSHTYREEQAMEIFRKLPSYAAAMKRLYDRVPW